MLRRYHPIDKIQGNLQCNTRGKRVDFSEQCEKALHGYLEQAPKGTQLILQKHITYLMYAIFTCYNDVITDKLKSHRKYDENLQFIQSLLVQERSTDQVTSYAFLQNFNPTANIICSI